MEDRAIRGIPWTMLSYAANKALRVSATIVLARLLAPADFGILALAVLSMAGINVLSDLGLGGALVVRQDLDRRAQGTVFGLMLVTGAVGVILVAGLAPLAALLFDEPRLTGVLAALSCTVLIRVAAWFYATLIQRELEFRRSFIGNVSETLTYITVTLVLATLGTGVWSLVIGDIASSIVLLATLFVLSPYRVRPAFDRTVASGLFADGRGFMVQGGFSFLRQNTDYAVIGRLLGPTALGFYSMAYRIGEIPYWGIAHPIANATFPGFARMRHRGEDVSGAFASTLRMVALVTCPLGVLLSATADPFTRLLFSDKWAPMIGALSVLGVWAAVRSLEETHAWFLNALGEAALLGRISALTLIALIPAAFVAGSLGGIATVGWVVVADSLFTLLGLSWFTSRRGGVPLAMQWEALRPIAIACPAAWAAAAAVASALHDDAPALALAASACAGLVVYAVAVRLADASLIADAAAQARRMFARAPAAAGRP